MFKTILKIFFLLIAILLLGWGGYCIVCAVQIHNIIQEMERPLVETTVELSKVNQYDFSLPPVRDYFHGLGIWIEIDVKDKQEEELEEYLTGLRGLVVVGIDDEIISETTLDDDIFYGYLDAKKDGSSRAFLILMDQFRGHESEASQLSIQIDQPAEKLRGIEQKLQVKYKLCGCEHAARFLMSIFGSLSIVVGLLIGVPITCFLLPRKTPKPIPSGAQTHLNCPQSNS